MKSLKESLKESLLDDFEDIAITQDENNLNDLLKKADDAAKKGRLVTNSDKNHSSNSKIENNILYIPNYTAYIYTTDSHEFFMDAKKLKPYDTIQCSKFTNEFSLAVGHEANSKIAKIINIPEGQLKLLTRYINGLEINLDMSYPGLITNYNYDPNHKCYFENCKLNCTNRDAAGMRFDNIPEFHDCKITNFRSIYVYNANAIKDEDNKKLFDKIFDKNYTATYVDRKDPNKQYIRKGDLKTLYATVNIPKKYKFVETETNNKMFKVNEKFNLNDIINISNFDKHLSNIQIRDNNVGIIFYKPEELKDGGMYEIYAYYMLDKFSEKYHSEDLPNNPGWKVLVAKRMH